MTLFLFVFIFTLDDNNSDLGDDYYYLDKDEAYDVGSSYVAIVYKSDQKYALSEIIIDDEVMAVNKNDKFITVLQRIDAFKEIKDETIKVDSFNYYIIEKKTDIIYGPYDKTRYYEKGRELKVPNDIVLLED